MSDADLKQLYSEGKSAEEIGKLLNLSRTTILKRLRAAGVETRNAGQARRVARARGKMWKGMRFVYLDQA